MFDSYVPKPEISCPTCGCLLLNWQGKHGPCKMWVFEQGKDDKYHRQLPEKFVFTAECCGNYFVATGRCENGIWIETTVEQWPKDATSPIKILSVKLRPPPG